MLKKLLIAATIAAALGTPALASAAATYVVGAPITAKITHSSTGSACEASCWESWQITGIGAFMVVKDANGYITKAGQRRYDEELDDLFLSTDEAIRKLPTNPAIYRYGVVTNTSSGSTCSANCALGAFFGVPVVFVLNAQSAAAFIIDEPTLPVTPLGFSSDCGAGTPTNCTQMITGGGTPGQPYIVITVTYGADGEPDEIEVTVNSITIFHWTDS